MHSKSFHLLHRCLISNFGHSEFFPSLVELQRVYFDWFFGFRFVEFVLLSFVFSNFGLEGHEVGLLLFEFYFPFPALFFYLFHLVFEAFDFPMIIVDSLFQIHVIDVFAER